MPRYIAFLRAINVPRRTVKMADLRALFEAMGLTQVETFIQSGNVLFNSPSTAPAELEQAIEAHLQQGLDFAVPTFLRSQDDLMEVIAHHPFGDDGVDSPDLYIAFLKKEPGEERQRNLLTLASEVDALHVFNRHVFWCWRRELGDSNVSNARIEKKLGMQATTRNMSTVRKIAEL
jgi:uncharacterized protein (DUF1697 family)